MLVVNHKGLDRVLSSSLFCSRRCWILMFLWLVWISVILS